MMRTNADTGIFPDRQRIVDVLSARNEQDRGALAGHWHVTSESCGISSRDVRRHFVVVPEASAILPEASVISPIASATLNVKQNNLISDRSRLTKANIELFNDLRDSLHPILDAARAIYRGVDDVKLKDYTVLQLKKRINAEGKREVKQ